MDELEWAAQFRPPAAGSLTEVLAKATVMPDLADLAETAATKAAEEARATQREELLQANRAAGDPIGHVTRCQAQLAEQRDRIRDLEAQLGEARRREAHAAENLAHWSAAADEIRTAVAQRSDTGDLLGPAKAAHLEFVQTTRAAFAAVQAGRPARRRAPFVSRGDITRTELECWYCQQDGVGHEESVLAHLDPVLNLPITTKEQALAIEAAEQVKAERRGHLTGMEISR